MTIKDYVKKHKKAIGWAGAVTGVVAGTLAFIFLRKRECCSDSKCENQKIQPKISSSKRKAKKSTKKGVSAMPAKKAAKKATTKKK
jgi:hypothetical protein